MTLDTIMMYFGYVVFIFLSLGTLLIISLLLLLEMEKWYIFSPKQKFALLPKSVWNMKCKDYHESIIWLCWYWDSGKEFSNTKYYRLSDYEEPSMQWHRFTRTSTNTW